MVEVRSESKAWSIKQIPIIIYIYIQPGAVHPLPNANDVYLLPYLLPCSAFHEVRHLVPP